MKLKLKSKSERPPRWSDVQSRFMRLSKRCGMFVLLSMASAAYAQFNPDRMYPISNSAGTLTPNAFLMTNPNYPGSTSSQTELDIGLGFNYRDYRAIIWGGNLGVNQDVSGSFGAYLGKWSTKGAWQMPYNMGIVPPGGQVLVNPGIRYLVDYHRWGNYDALFGLRERATDVGLYYEGQTPPANPTGDIKDAVISWAYEYNVPQNAESRLVFQSIRGIDQNAWVPNTNGPYPVQHEHATILHTGNFGLGISAPAAHFHMKPDDENPNADHLQIDDAAGNTQVIIKNNGNVGINVSNPTDRFEVNGNSGLTGDLAVTGNSTLTGDMSVTGKSILSSPASVAANYRVFNVRDKSAADILVAEDNGSIYLDKLKTGVDQMLYLDGNGKVFGNNVVSPTNMNTYFIGGNTAGTFGDRIFGFNDNANISVKTNGAEAFRVHGRWVQGTQTWYKTGFTQFHHNVWVGGAPSTNQWFANNLLSLKPGLFETTSGGFFPQSTLLVGYDVNDNERYRLERNGAFSLGMDYYNVGGNDCYPGIHFDPQYEFLAVDQNKHMTLGYEDGIGYNKRFSINSVSDYGIIINNTLPDVKNHITVWDGSSQSRITGNGSLLSGKLDLWGNLEILGNVDCHLIPAATATYDLGSSSYRWRTAYTTNALNTSDRRLKENIEYIRENGLQTIMKLKPVNFTWKDRQVDELTHYGFIAQELKEIFPNSIVMGDEDTGTLGVLYSEIIPILTKGIQEQQEMIDTLKRQINLLVSANKQKETIQGNKQHEVLNQRPLLFQNTPNPFSGITFIDYFLPPNASNAFIRVVDNNGKLIKAFPLNAIGYGQVELDCRNIAAGTYHYTLMVNSETVDTKTMIVADAR